MIGSAQAQPTEPAATFFGLPRVTLDEIPRQGLHTVLVGAGSSLGSALDGAQNGPFFLRALSKAHTWSAERPTVLTLQDHAQNPLAGGADLGDLDLEGQNLPDVLGALEATVATLASNGVVCGVVGGDHSLTLGAVRALHRARQRPFKVVQFDHHLDLQTWGTPGPTPARRDDVFNTNVMSHIADLLGPGCLVQVGVDPYTTVELANRAAVEAHLAEVGEQVSLFSRKLSVPRAVAQVVGTAGDVYVSVDVDVLESAAMSSTGYPAEVGLRVNELTALIDAVLESHRLIGFDVMEFATPRTARDAKTLADGCRANLVLLRLLGWASRQAAACPR